MDELHIIFWFFVVAGGLLLGVRVLSRSDGYPDNDDLPGMDGRRYVEEQRRNWQRNRSRNEMVENGEEFTGTTGRGE